MAVAAVGVAFAAGTGNLRFVNAKFDGQGDITGLDFAWDVVASPDGRSVYVTGDQSDSLVTFRRNLDTGKLRYVNTKVEGQGGITGLDAANGLAMSPDARNVYVAAATNSIATFKRNRRTGKLKFVNVKIDGINGVDGIDVAEGVAVSPNGKSVYVTGYGDNALATFKRNRKTGKLKFLNAKVDGQGGVDGIASTFDLTVAPDGRNVYASGNADNAVASFKRNVRTGRLRFLGARFDGQGDVDGLVGAYLMSSSPDGHNVYVTADNDNSVVTFRRH